MHSFITVVGILLTFVLRQSLNIAVSRQFRTTTPHFAGKGSLENSEAQERENESESERRERLRIKARKMMFNEKGVAYAPWMVRQIDEEVGGGTALLGR